MLNTALKFYNQKCKKLFDNKAMEDFQNADKKKLRNNKF